MCDLCHDFRRRADAAHRSHGGPGQLSSQPCVGPFAGAGTASALSLVPAASAASTRGFCDHFGIYTGFYQVVFNALSSTISAGLSGLGDVESLISENGPCWSRVSLSRSQARQAFCRQSPGWCRQAGSVVRPPLCCPALRTRQRPLQRCAVSALAFRAVRSSRAHQENQLTQRA